MYEEVEVLAPIRRKPGKKLSALEKVFSRRTQRSASTWNMVFGLPYPEYSFDHLALLVSDGIKQAHGLPFELLTIVPSVLPPLDVRNHAQLKGGPSAAVRVVLLAHVESPPDKDTFYACKAAQHRHKYGCVHRVFGRDLEGRNDLQAYNRRHVPLDVYFFSSRGRTRD